MSKDIDEDIARINNILTNSNKININEKLNNPPGKTKKKKNKKTQNDNQLFNYKSTEQLESLWNRAIILHTQGIYIKPSQSHVCNKKKRKREGKKNYCERKSSGQMPKKTFGSGRIGVSCEAYGVKNCSCCAPKNYEDVLLMQSHISSDHKPEDLPFKHCMSASHPSDYIDLTKSSKLFHPSSSKNWDNSVITISDSSQNNSLLMIPDEVDDDFQSITPITETENIDRIIKNENVDTVIKTENIDLPAVQNFANVDNITDYINLVTTDYDEHEMRKYEEELEETINTHIKTEVLEMSAAPKFANADIIIDYINLVTTDYDEEEMRRYEEELEETIQITDFEMSAETNTIPENVPTINRNHSNSIQIIESPVPSKPITLDSSPPGLSCPVCLESLTHKEVMSTICGHLFCSECIKEVIRKTKCCPNCRKKLTLKSIHPIYLS